MLMSQDNSDEKHGNSLPESGTVNISDKRIQISQPRPPRNLQDLLRFSTEVTAASGHDDSENQSLSRSNLDKEDKKFLDNAIKSMTVDVVAELLKCIEILKHVGSASESDDLIKYEEALDNIFDYVDNLDVANDFYKIGGFCVFKPCLESENSSLRWRGAELIAELCQNNPYCQKRVIDMGLMPYLLKMVDKDTVNIVQVKALYAVSCVSRDSEDGLQEFLTCDGLGVLLRALESDTQKLIIKSAFMLSSLCQWKPQIKEDLINMKYIQQIIRQIALHVQKFNKEHSASLEHLLNALLVIVENNTRAQDISQEPDLNFKSILEFIVKNSNDIDQCHEINEYAKKLTISIFGESEKDNENT